VGSTLIPIEPNTASKAAVNFGPLTAEQRDQLVAAQAQVRRLLRLAAVTIEAVDDGASVARYCLRAYASELALRFPEGYDDSTLAKPGELVGDAGALLVAREEGRPAGCVVWRRLGPDVAEVRNLWVGAEARGLGLGRRLLGAVETDAAAHGIAVMRLGTHRVLTEAIALYRSSGYREISSYDESRTTSWRSRSR
jgi:ribosomal protein S18 acetylase RimI-like enzyme